jgi:hypothetical protein
VPGPAAVLERNGGDHDESPGRKADPGQEASRA